MFNLQDEHIRRITRKQEELKARTQHSMLVCGLVIAVGIMIIVGILAVIKIDRVMQEQVGVKLRIESLEQHLTVDLTDDTEEVEGLSHNDTKEPQIDSYALTDAERNLVERVVMAEARGEPFGGMMGVAQVIRCRAEEWGLTVTEVVTAPSQFAKPYGGEISDEVKEAVRMVFDYGTVYFEEGVTHFHADWINAPYWTENKANRGKVGRNIFYK